MLKALERTKITQLITIRDNQRKWHEYKDMESNIYWSDPRLGTSFVNNRDGIVSTFKVEYK